MTFVDGLKFSGGLAFLDGFQVYVCPVNYFLTLFNYIYINSSEDLVRSGLRKVSSIDMKILFEELSNSSKYEGKVLFEFLKRINKFGFGEIGLVSYRDNKIVFSQKNPHLSGLYRNIFGDIPNVLVEEIILGFLMNFISFFSGKKVVGSLESKGNVLIYTVDVLDEEFVFKNEFIYPEFVPGRVSSLVKKIILDRGIVVEDGVFKLSGMVGITLPYFFVFEIIRNFNLTSDNVFFKALGIIQGKAAVDMHNHFGSSLGADCYNSIMNLTGISGIGDIYLSCSGEFRRSIFKSNIFKYYSLFYSDDILDVLLKHFHHMSQGGYEFCFDEVTHLNMNSPSEIVFEFISSGRAMSDLEKDISKSLSTKILITNNN